jgi:GDP-L-fucose synthase
MFKNKNVLVTGGSGMIGRQLVPMLLLKGANVFVADLNEPVNMPGNFTFLKIDLKEFSDCRKVCKGMDYVFSLVGIKASPKACLEQPANIMGPMIQFNTNMLEAAMWANVDWYLYTSTIGVYQPAPILTENDLWQTVPSKNDWYGGWAKRIGEMQIEAFEKQYGSSKCSIVRPANVYGTFDNFDLSSAMVIPSLIRKADENEVLDVWGDGSQIRDFINCKDVARGMLYAVENKITKPINLGSGSGVSIKQIAEIVSQYFNKPIQWNPTGVVGDAIRILDMKRANSYGFYPEINIEQGIIETIEWYLENKSIICKRYNSLQS